MKIQQIRNSTLKISYAGKIILTDPVLLPKHGFESFAGIEKNPTVELPLPVNDIIKDIDLVMVSHLHHDHFDDGAKKMLPKNIPIFCQPGDDTPIKKSGFLNVTSIETSIEWENIQITRTPAKHASNKKWENILGRISGFIYKAAGEPVVYWAGDTVLYDEIKTIIADVQPDIILTHSCGATIQDSGPIVMDEKQTVEICNIAPRATVIATHMEALDHATVSRKALRAYARENGITDTQLIIPKDGQTLNL